MACQAAIRCLASAAAIRRSRWSLLRWVTWWASAYPNADRVVAWGCGGRPDHGQCRVPVAARSGVIAIAAGYGHSLALKKGGSVVAWGCGNYDFGQCRVPAAVRSGVIAIAAGYGHSLA